MSIGGTGDDIFEGVDYNAAEEPDLIYYELGSEGTSRRSFEPGPWGRVSLQRRWPACSERG